MLDLAPIVVRDSDNQAGVMPRQGKDNPQPTSGRNRDWIILGVLGANIAMDSLSFILRLCPKYVIRSIISS